jgi:hypothetical protein
MTPHILLHQRICPPLLALFALFASACSTLPSGERWGQNASFPGWETLKTSAWNAARDPHTWVPLAGAVVMSIGDLDEDLSDWAVRENPLFGSESSADDASDVMVEALAGTAIISALSTPGGPREGWAGPKLKGMLVETSAAMVAGGITSSLKSSINRRRPDDSDNRSFPSAHASSAASYAMLTNRNLDAINMSPGARKVLKYSATTVSGLTAWARIESRDHYPSDVLAGAALGYFITAVLHDAMMGLDTPVQVGVKLDGDSGGMLTFHMPFQ